MASDSSLNHSMDGATKHYSSMFFLPSYKTVLIGVAALCIIAVNLCTFLLFPSLGSLALGISLFALVYISDTVVSKILLKTDPISYTHLRAHETDSYLVCRLLLE